MSWRGGALARGRAACFKRRRPASQTACLIRATRGRLRMRLMRPARCSQSPAASPSPAATSGLPGCHQPPWAAPSRQPTQFHSGRGPQPVNAHPCAATDGRQEDIDAAWMLPPPPAASPLSPATSCLLLAQPPQFNSGHCIPPFAPPRRSLAHSGGNPLVPASPRLRLTPRRCPGPPLGQPPYDHPERCGAGPAPRVWRGKVLRRRRIPSGSSRCGHSARKSPPRGWRKSG